MTYAYSCLTTQGLPTVDHSSMVTKLLIILSMCFW